MLWCSSNASNASTKASTTTSLLRPGECESTRMASAARGRTMAKDGVPLGASCSRGGPRSDWARPRQKTAFSASNAETSSDASTRLCRPSAFVAPGFPGSPSWTAVTSKARRRKASARASSKLPSKAMGPGSGAPASGSSSEAGTMASAPSSPWQRASPSVTNSTQQRRPSERRVAKLPSGRSSTESRGASSRTLRTNSCSSAFSRQCEKSTPRDFSRALSSRIGSPLTASGRGAAVSAGP
mmetsp:Transcript_24857/g.77270  ORF Transcript_24857/g.77270 Transcript_24857/m.77270 type:complete len:241 (+) Transcript_24857:639-1361(+)